MELTSIVLRTEDAGSSPVVATNNKTPCDVAQTDRARITAPSVIALFKD
jgi:hypothetical protein